jgi:hypothetical protein
MKNSPNKIIFLLKKIAYFGVLFFLTFFCISFSIKNEAKIQNLKLSIVSKISPLLDVSGFALYPIKMLNKPENYTEERQKIELNLLEIQTKRDELLTKSLQNFNNIIFNLHLSKFNILVVSPSYYSSGGFLTDVIFAKNKELILEINQNSAVISEDGLYGRISVINQKSFTIIPIFNSASRIPVYAKNSKIYGIMSGDGAETIFIYPNEEATFIIDGEEVLTSGENNLIISEIPVGKISKQSNKIIIIPYAKTRPKMLGIIY